MLRHCKEPSRVDCYVVKLDGLTSACQGYDQALLIETEEEPFFSACIKCAKPQCVTYFDEEYLCDEVIGFAADLDNRVCPTRSIQWSNQSNEFEIDQSTCINCGLCAVRCPFGAIYESLDGQMTINKDRSIPRYELVPYNDDSVKFQSECSEAMESLTSERKHHHIDMERIEHIYKSIEGNNEVAAILCRNLIIESGWSCALRRIGDVYTRMDAIFEREGVHGVVEIEYGADTLSVARNLLDDLAMLQTRYSLVAKKIIPVALCMTIPNTRQGYFQVCEDIRSVLGIKIRTLTVGALLALVWSGAELHFWEDNFCLAFRETSIKEDLEQLVGGTIENDGLNLGIYDSVK